MRDGRTVEVFWDWHPKYWVLDIGWLYYDEPIYIFCVGPFKINYYPWRINPLRDDQ